MAGNRPVPWPRVQSALRPLNDEELALLEQSIVEDGVLEAVKLLPDGRIVDGHHRFLVATRLGRRVPRRVLDVDEDRAFRIAMRLNAARRQLTNAERRAAIEQTLLVDPERTNVDVAREHGVSNQTVMRVRSAIPPTPTRSTTASPSGEAARRRRPRRATAQEKARARLMAADGVKQSSIAAALDRPATTISMWLGEPQGVDEVAAQREQKRLRDQHAWKRLVELNDRARRVWAEDRGAILRAIDEHPEHNLIVALGHATRRTRDVAQAVLDAIDPKLNDAERQRMDAFARDSGFG